MKNDKRYNKKNEKPPQESSSDSSKSDTTFTSSAIQLPTVLAIPSDQKRHTFGLDSYIAIYILNNKRHFTGPLTPSNTIIQGIVRLANIPLEGPASILIMNPLGKLAKLALSNAQYLPNSPMNLISLMKLRNHGHQIDSNLVLRHLDTDEGIVQCENEGNLLTFKSLNSSNTSDSPDATNAFALTTTAASRHTWHRRLGHIGHETLTKVSNTTATGIRITDYEKHDCEECACIKIRKQPHRRRAKSKEKGALIYINSVPRIRPTAYNGSVGYTTMVDDASLRSDIRFIKSKGEIP